MEQRSPMRADVTAGRFLSDLRALRTQAGLDHGELAARAHYPRDVIAAAEAGPYLPVLPVLAAYVRGCGGTGDEILAWEDRWRTVTGSKTHPLLSARVGGLSGANRPLSPENSDPEAIRSALHRFGSRMSQPEAEPGAGASREESQEEPGDTAPRPAPAASVTPASPAASTAPAAPAAMETPSASQSSPAAQVTSATRTRSASATPPVAKTPGTPDRSGLSGPTIAVAAIIAALVILLIVLLM